MARYRKLEDLSDPPSLGLRLAVVGSAIACCVSCAGLAFGFSALVPELLELGAFHEEILGERYVYTHIIYIYAHL